MLWRGCARGLPRAKCSLGDDLDEDAVGERCSTEDVNDAVAGEAAEHGGGFGVGVGVGWGGGFGGVRGGFERRGCGLTGSVGALHAAIHGLVGEAVGVFVLVAEGVGDLEGIEAGDAAFGLL